MRNKNNVYVVEFLAQFAFRTVSRADRPSFPGLVIFISDATLFYLLRGSYIAPAIVAPVVTAALDGKINVLEFEIRPRGIAKYF